MLDFPVRSTSIAFVKTRPIVCGAVILTVTASPAIGLLPAPV